MWNIKCEIIFGSLSNCYFLQYCESNNRFLESDKEKSRKEEKKIKSASFNGNIARENSNITIAILENLFSICVHQY